MKKITNYSIKVFSIFLFIGIFIFGMNSKVFASDCPKRVILGGDTIGLRLDTGIFIAGKYQVQTSNGKVSPWKNSDVKDGDKIIAFNQQPISTNAELLKLLKDQTNEVVQLTLDRDGKQIKTNIDVVITKNKDKSLGLYIKDRLLGIGTLTFIDPKTATFASLGHGIYDDNVVIGTQVGSIMTSKIEGIKKAVPGVAGEKRASLTTNVLGKIISNKITGVYGKITSSNLLKHKTIEVAMQNEVEVGKAKILTVIDGNRVEEFDIQIKNVNIQNAINVKGLKFEVIDKRLIEKTGGIVQGMSGSPIVQNGKLIGAVSHVTVDNPTIGYGIHIEWMLEDIVK